MAAFYQPHFVRTSSALWTAECVRGYTSPTISITRRSSVARFDRLVPCVLCLLPRNVGAGADIPVQARALGRAVFGGRRERRAGAHRRRQVDAVLGAAGHRRRAAWGGRHHWFGPGCQG